PWKLLVVVSGMASFIVLTFIYIWAICQLGLVKNAHVPKNNSQNLGEILVVVPGVFISMPRGFFLGDVVAWWVPSARRSLHEHAAEEPAAGDDLIDLFCSARHEGGNAVFGHWLIDECPDFVRTLGCLQHFFDLLLPQFGIELGDLWVVPPAPANAA